MNKLFWGTIFLALAFVLPAQAIAGVNVDVNISLPPPIVFAAPPALVVLPETYVYVVPDSEEDIFFYGGWWWRPWEGRWYRSQRYSSGWVYYRSVPSFYREIPSGWRTDYREHRWRGHQWDYRPIPQKQVQQNWRGWEKNKHWEKQNSWGVRDLKSQPRPHQPTHAIEPQHQGKPQVREPVRHEQPRPQSQEVKQPQRHIQGKPEVREPVKREQPKLQPQEVKQQKHEVQQQSNPRQGKPDRGKDDKQDRGQDDKQDRKQHDK